MEVQFACPEGADLTQLRKAYPDLYHDDTYDGSETWWIGQSGEEYWDSKRSLYNYGSDDLSEQRDESKEWMTSAEAAEFCGFAETLIPDSETLLEGNGGWAQGKLRGEEDYLRGVRKAEFLVAVENAKKVLKPGDRLRVSKCPGTKGPPPPPGWVTNAVDYGRADAHLRIVDYDPVEYRKWVDQFVIGDPRASAQYTCEQMKEMGLIGLYKKEAGE